MTSVKIKGSFCLNQFRLKSRFDGSDGGWAWQIKWANSNWWDWQMTSRLVGRKNIFCWNQFGLNFHRLVSVFSLQMHRNLFFSKGFLLQSPLSLAPWWFLKHPISYHLLRLSIQVYVEIRSDTDLTSQQRTDPANDLTSAPSEPIYQKISCHQVFSI